MSASIYRKIYTTFWTDPKVLDEFSPEDKFFYLYLLTNPHSTLSGCYEISSRAIANDTGYNKETVEKLIDRFTNYGVIEYDPETKEVLLKHWGRYNWTISEKFLKAVVNSIEDIKSAAFKKYVATSVEEKRISKAKDCENEG